jgi:conjugative transfer region protein (TIGR03750 family)
MILHEINHKMPIYKDCTLGEMLGIGALVFMSEAIVFSLLTRFLFGYAAIGIALTLVSFFHLTKMFLSQLQKIKYGKPYGYYQQWCVKKWSTLKGGRILYITRLGKWSVWRKP